MRKVCLTEQQRIEAALERTYQKIADGLAAFQNRERLNQAQMAQGLGMNPKSLSKLMKTDCVQLDIKVLLNAIRIAGYKVVPSDPL